MGQIPVERLKEYLGQLPPQAQALLMREFERGIERGEDVAVATFVLGLLRTVVRSDEAERPRADDGQPRKTDPSRRTFRPLDPFLVEVTGAVRPGQIRRGSLALIWQWLVREGAPDKVQALEAALAASGENSQEADVAARRLQLAASEAIQKMAGPAAGTDRQRLVAHIGPPSITDDLMPVALVLQNREALDGLNGRLQSNIRVLGDSQISSIIEAINVPSLQTPQMLPFALSLVMKRLAAPWQIIRLAIKVAASDDELRVAATPFGVAVTIALHDLSSLATVLRGDIRRGHFLNMSDMLKTLHDGVRGLRTELDLRSESTWGKQLATLRSDISNALQSEIESVPGRVRRILRQRADKDIPAGTVDATEVTEIAALIEFVAVCRTYASELAINEVTLRTYSDLQQYVEKSTEALVQSLRSGDAKARGYRKSQVTAAIKFCNVLFGQEYASLMTRAAENAAVVESKNKRAS